MLASVLFVSVRNSVRTHMATAWFNALAHPLRARATSAGTEPADALGDHVAGVMKEIGLDMADARPRLYTPLLAGAADLVIVISPPALELSLREVGIARDGWLIEEPSCDVDSLRRTRQGVEKLTRGLLAARDWMPLGG
jgi:arsenate reductase